MNIQYADVGAFRVLSNNSTSYISKTEFMMNVYAKLGQLEILSSYITEVTVGDVLTIEALVTNPLDWQHFYEVLSTMRKGDRQDFTVVTSEGDRLAGVGDLVEIEKWSDRGHFGFKVKASIKKQKSLTDKRMKAQPKQKTEKEKSLVQIPKDQRQPSVRPASKIPVPAVSPNLAITKQDMAEFAEMLKESVALDIPE